MTLEISPQHHSVVQGYNKMNLQHIRGMTGTTIMFPDLTDPHIPPLRKNTVSIRGSLENVLQARLMLMVRKLVAHRSCFIHLTRLYIRVHCRSC